VKEFQGAQVLMQKRKLFLRVLTASPGLFELPRQYTHEEYIEKSGSVTRFWN
jgi:hypothetical protein